jgi:hypothetical protein
MVLTPIRACRSIHDIQLDDISAAFEDCSRDGRAQEAVGPRHWPCIRSVSEAFFWSMCRESGKTAYQQWFDCPVEITGRLVPAARLVMSWLRDSEEADARSPLSSL